MFESINNSIRKLGALFSSPLPASTLGKRKADSDEEFEHTSRVEQALSAGDADDASDEETNYYGYKPPRLPQKRTQGTTPSNTTMKRTSAVEQSTAATQKANDAIRRARQIMGKVETMPDISPKEREIQEELERQERQERQERIDRDGLFALARNKRSPTTGKYRRKSAASAFDDNTELSPGILKSKLVPDSSVLGKSDPCSPADEHTVGRASPMAKWHIKPHLRARQLLEANGHDTAALLEDLQEPAYVCRDAEIRDGICKLTNQIEDFAKSHFVFAIEDWTRLRSAFESMAPETVKIIGCVASGGPAGASGWEDLFLTADKRQALVCAIIGNVLIEQVFQYLFFGGTEDQINEVAAIQFEHRNDDGFDRNKLYADKIREFITSTSRKGKAPVDRPTSTLHLPVTFSTHINHIVAAITTHLSPILTLNHDISTVPSILPALHAITTHAALLSLHMRLDPQTHYAFTPIFKEQPYIHSEMHPSNHAAMLATHPKGNGDTDGISAAEQSRRARLSPEELIIMKRDEPLVQIALFPGLIAYRLGGWETRASTATNQRFEAGCEGRGFRARRLTEAWVYCRWGRPRVFEDGKPADDPEVHGARWKGGFVEFLTGVGGICDPDLEGTARRAQRRRSTQESLL